MALSKYIAVSPPAANHKLYLGTEFNKVALSIGSIIAILEILNVPVEVGAPNSGGAGFRMLRIPN